MTLQHIYGPVNSRRLGKSLGISIVKMKTCNFDCIYCELGRSLIKTSERGLFAGEKEIIAELDVFFKARRDPVDILTITGYGEPTLNENLTAIARSVKEKFPQYRLALLTNSSYLDDIEDSYGYFDVIMPSLNAIGDDAFNRINRPAPGFASSEIVAKLINLRKSFTGSLELEILFCKGINDGTDEIFRLYDAVKKIKPSKVWINTVVRHPAYDEAIPIDGITVGKLERIFNSNEITIKQIHRREYDLY